MKDLISLRFFFNLKIDVNMTMKKHSAINSHFIYLLLLLASCIGRAKTTPRDSPYPSYIKNIKKVNPKITPLTINNDIKEGLKKDVFIKKKLVKKATSNKEVIIKLFIHGFANSDNNKTQVFSNVISRICKPEYDKPITILAPKISDTKIDLYKQCEQVYKELNKELTKIRNTNSIPKIVISGYSMGGIVALLLALRLKEDGKAQDIKGLNIIAAPLGGLGHLEKIYTETKKDDVLKKAAKMLLSVLLEVGDYENRPQSLNQLNKLFLNNLLKQAKGVIDENNISTKIISADKPKFFKFFSDESIINISKKGHMIYSLTYNKKIKPFEYYFDKLKNIINSALTKNNDLVIPVTTQIWDSKNKNIENIVLQGAIHGSKIKSFLDPVNSGMKSVLDTQKLAEIIIDSIKHA